MGSNNGALRQFWDALPITGAGLIGPADPGVRRLLRDAAFDRIHKAPGALRPVVLLAANLLWCVKAVLLTRRAAKALGFGAREAIRQYADVALLGQLPKDSHLWRHMLGGPRRPLSSNAFAKIQASVGDAAEREVLTDKLATAERLVAAGVPVPVLLAVLPRGADPVLPDGRDLFVKPRRGARSRHAFAATGAPDVTRRLRAALAEDELLVQQRIAVAPELADLATDGVPPVLRLVTVREPGGEPFLHSALFSIRVPGERPQHVMRALLRVPVSVADGRLSPGYWPGAPESRYAESPWHKAPIADRALPGFDQAVRAALAAHGAFGGLAMVGWDVILSDAGPVVIEGNGHTDWLWLTAIAEGAPNAVSLLALHARWAAHERRD